MYKDLKIYEINNIIRRNLKKAIYDKFGSVYRFSNQFNMISSVVSSFLKESEVESKAMSLDTLIKYTDVLGLTIEDVLNYKSSKVKKDPIKTVFDIAQFNIMVKNKLKEREISASKFLYDNDIRQSYFNSKNKGTSVRNLLVVSEVLDIPLSECYEIKSNSDITLVKLSVKENVNISKSVYINNIFIENFKKAIKLKFKSFKEFRSYFDFNSSQLYVTINKTNLNTGMKMSRLVEYVNVLGLTIGDIYYGNFNFIKGKLNNTFDRDLVNKNFKTALKNKDIQYRDFFNGLETSLGWATNSNSHTNAYLHNIVEISEKIGIPIDKLCGFNMIELELEQKQKYTNEYIKNIGTIFLENIKACVIYKFESYDNFLKIIKKPRVVYVRLFLHRTKSFKYLNISSVMEFCKNLNITLQDLYDGKFDTGISYNHESEFSRTVLLKNINELLKEKNINITNLLHYTNLSHTQLSSFNDIDYDMSINTICILAEYLNVNIDYICGFTDNRYTTNIEPPVSPVINIEPLIKSKTKTPITLTKPVTIDKYKDKYKDKLAYDVNTLTNFLKTNYQNTKESEIITKSILLDLNNLDVKNITIDSVYEILGLYNTIVSNSILFDLENIFKEEII